MYVWYVKGRDNWTALTKVIRDGIDQAGEQGDHLALLHFSTGQEKTPSSPRDSGRETTEAEAPSFTEDHIRVPGSSSGCC